MNDRQRKAVEYLKEKGRITRREYVKMSNVSDRMANINLKDLEEKNLIDKMGLGRSVYYVLR